MYLGWVRYIAWLSLTSFFQTIDMTKLFSCCHLMLIFSNDRYDKIAQLLSSNVDFYERCYFVGLFGIEEHKTGIILHHAVCSGFHASQNWHYSTSLRLNTGIISALRFTFRDIVSSRLMNLYFQGRFGRVVKWQRIGTRRQQRCWFKSRCGKK